MKGFIKGKKLKKMGLKAQVGDSGKGGTNPVFPQTTIFSNPQGFQFSADPQNSVVFDVSEVRVRVHNLLVRGGSVPSKVRTPHIFKNMTRPLIPDEISSEGSLM